jgi:hypothetical protein
MSKGRRSDKRGFKEKGGLGHREKYKLWILPREIPSNGSPHEILNWKHNIVHSLEVE